MLLALYTKKIYLAGGDFHELQAVFAKLRGVTDTRTGYINAEGAANFAAVADGRVKARMGVEVSFDPKKTDISTLLDVFFAAVNPYLGTDGIEPFLKVCREEKKGIFILVKTSNPSSGEFQDRLVEGKPLYELVAEKVDQWAQSCMGDTYSYVGAVVGATHPEIGAELRQALPHTFFLVPGYGAQGGRGEDLAGFFDTSGGGAIVNSSRAVMTAYKKEGCAGSS